MRKLNLLALVAAVVCCSCSSGGAGSDEYSSTPGEKSDKSITKANGAVVNGGVADTAPTPAPEGVKTGIPK